MPTTIDDGQALTSYLLRRSRLAGIVCELEDLQTCERRNFATLEALCRFLHHAWDARERNAANGGCGTNGTPSS